MRMASGRTGWSGLWEQLNKSLNHKWIYYMHVRVWHNWSVLCCWGRICNWSIDVCHFYLLTRSLEFISVIEASELKAVPHIHYIDDYLTCVIYYSATGDMVKFFLYNSNRMFPLLGFSSGLEFSLFTSEEAQRVKHSVAMVYNWVMIYFIMSTNFLLNYSTIIIH